MNFQRHFGFESLDSRMVIIPFPLGVWDAWEPFFSYNHKGRDFPLCLTHLSRWCIRPHLYPCSLDMWRSQWITPVQYRRLMIRSKGCTGSRLIFLQATYGICLSFVLLPISPFILGLIKSSQNEFNTIIPVHSPLNTRDCKGWSDLIRSPPISKFGLPPKIN